MNSCSRDARGEIEINVSNEKNNKNNGIVWTSCCLRLNKHAVLFFAQLFISLIVMGFSIYMLVRSTSCEHDALYSGLLSMIIGVWIKAPSISHSSK